jgi:putative ABC transport system substrate-binding protein
MGGLQRRNLSIAAAVLLLAPLRGLAQQPAPPRRIGYLGFNSAVIGKDLLLAFRQALRDLGWTDGQNIVIDARFADGDVGRLPALAAELLALDVDLLATSSSAATRAGKAATTNVPIVMLASADAVGEGFVASLAHPGGNITGMTFLSGPEIAGKQLGLLREIAPAATRVAFLMNPHNNSHAAYAAELKSAAQKLGVQLQPVHAGAPDDLGNAFAAMSKARAAALLVLTDAMFLGQRRRIVELARAGALPAMYSQREFVDAGGLASYGPSLADMAHRGAKQVDKILRGAKPADVPVEQSTRLELVLNLTTARDLRLAIPPSVLSRVDDLVR